MGPIMLAPQHAAKPGDRGKLSRVAPVAERLDLPERRVYELVRAGVLPHVRVGRSIRFDLDAIEKWIGEGGAGYPRDNE